MKNKEELYKEAEDLKKLNEDGELKDDDAEEATGGWAPSCPPTEAPIKKPQEVL